MLVNCNSCQKKFVVPDSAITDSGRLVQCGSCGNKWTQYPNKNITTNETVFVEKATPKIKVNTVKKTKPKKNLYTAEYLRKKHGLVIENSGSQLDKKIKKNPKMKSSFGFYSYLIFLFVFAITLFGILELTNEIIVMKYPFLELYINYFYEVIEIIKLSLTEFTN